MRKVWTHYRKVYASFRNLVRILREEVRAGVVGPHPLRKVRTILRNCSRLLENCREFSENSRSSADKGAIKSIQTKLNAFPHRRLFSKVNRCTCSLKHCLSRKQRCDAIYVSRQNDHVRLSVVEKAKCARWQGVRGMAYRRNVRIFWKKYDFLTVPLHDSSTEIR